MSDIALSVTSEELGRFKRHLVAIISIASPGAYVDHPAPQDWQNIIETQPGALDGDFDRALTDAINELLRGRR